MESVGQKLRATRLQLGLTLEAISAKTRITIRNLQAIENDNVSQFTSAFFYKSFVRQFARQLNLEFEELAAAVEAVTSQMPEPLMPGQAERTSLLPKVPALHPSRPKKLRWLHSFTSLIVMLVACTALYAVWQNARPNLLAAIVGFVHLSPKPSNPAVAGVRVPRPGLRSAASAHLALTRFIPNGE